MKEVFWNATTEQLDVSATGIGMPRSASSGDERYPALAASILAPQGAMVAAWNDYFRETSLQAEPDVRVEVIPLPILRNP